ncbi:MAG: cobalt ECF transporter T component CbiQ [Chthoniobacterales bacterium]|nr:cobalt ECF transporter T component CbiQ [Chthoniobacterales bacterium]
MSSRSFLERSLASFVAIIEQAIVAEEFARRDGFLQKLDPRVKLGGFLALIFVSVATHNLAIVAATFFLATALAFFSEISLSALALRAWLPVALFTGVIAMPALFLTPGPALIRAPMITANGLRAATFLIGRAETAATCALILVLSTKWPHLLHALRALRLPRAVIVVLGMTQRYIFFLLRAAQDLFAARRSRIIAPLDGRTRRHLAAANAGVLISRSLDLSGEVYAAMQARGFRGEIHTLEALRMRPNDWLALTLFLAVAVTLFWVGGH